MSTAQLEVKKRAKYKIGSKISRDAIGRKNTGAIGNYK